MTINRKLSEVDKYNDEVIAFFKFTNFTDSLLNGDLYMNPLQKYIEMERESGKKGVGDVLEAAQVISDFRFNIYKEGTNEFTHTGAADYIHFRINGDEKKPVYCLFTLHANDLLIVDENDTEYITVMNFSKEEVDKMLNEFGEQVALINPGSFIERVEKTFDEKGFGYVISPVKYDDYSINSIKRIESYKKNNNEIFFWKDNFFENQKEYRIVITSIETEEPLIPNIGNLNDIVDVFNARELFNGNFQIRAKK